MIHKIKPQQCLDMILLRCGSFFTLKENLIMYMVRLSFFFLISALLLSGHALANNNLNQIQKNIAEQINKINQQKKEQTQLQNELKQQEQTIANHYNQLEKVQNDLTNLTKQVKNSETEIAQLTQKQSLLKKQLSKQLLQAFKIKRSNLFDLIFDPSQNQRNERIIQYYAYLNKQKQTLLLELQETNKEIIQKQNLLQQNLLAQQELADQVKKEHADLLAQQTKRQKTLSVLQSSMQQNQTKLNQLKAEEKNLKNRLKEAEEANRLAANIERQKAAEIAQKEKQNNYKPTIEEKSLLTRVSGLGSPSRQYSWPVQGSLLHRFGEKINSELYWKGLVIRASEGTPVKSISAGKVILANWLEGYGFIVAIDHGKGDMSLYAYNQRLIVKTGQTIAKNQTIAYVGNSGGQATSALYFEIRREGKPLDPRRWLK